MILMRATDLPIGELIRAIEAAGWCVLAPGELPPWVVYVGQFPVGALYKVQVD